MRAVGIAAAVVVAAGVAGTLFVCKKKPPPVPAAQNDTAKVEARVEELAESVRSLEDARNYLRTGPLDMYARHGFGLYRVARKDDDVAIGMCGLIKRDTLPDVDIGFAFFPEHWGKGYAYEAASAVLDLGYAKFGLARILAITSPHNVSSIRLLERMGLRFERLLELTPNDPVKLFSRESPNP